MASETYSNLCHDIYEKIYRKLERRNEEGHRFATKGTAKEVLHYGILLRFFRSLLLPGRTAIEQFSLTEEGLVTRVKERQLHDFLAILIFATCRIEAARIFATEIVATDVWPARSRTGTVTCSLPAERAELIELFRDVVTADRFIMTQSCFCPVVIRKREEVRVRNPEAQRLPYLEEQLLAKGSFGTVFKVRIAKGHFYDPLPGVANHGPIDLARKDYIISNELSAQSEREIMEKILTSDRMCKNILENYGSLDIGPTTYSLFMPLAICDLRAYMMEHHRTRPTTTMEKAMMILSAEGLAGGLNFLHNEITTSDMEDLVCYHMDLKPSNILIFRETIDGKPRNIWKLSDFGMARVKIRRRGQDGEREKDFNSWFVRRQKPQDPSLSATLNRRGEGTYLAPESISSTKSMKAESDVWSLGCVISVVFAYLEEGSDGVTRYQNERMQHLEADGYDRFFLRNKRFAPTKVHPEVNKWHTLLIAKASQRDPDEGEAVKSILRYLEDAVFQISQLKRRGAKEVEKMLRNTFMKYRSLGEAKRDEGLGGKQHNSLGKSMLQKIRPRLIGHRTEPAVDRQVEEWYLSACEAFKGCEISPDGTLVAYWTDIKISLYTSQSLPTGRGNVASPAAEYPLEISDCIWKSIGVTQKYLIASTTGANFQCYIFDLERGFLVDATLDHWFRVVLPLPEITKLAISPDSQTVTCVLRGKEEDRNTGSLFIASVSELIKAVQRSPSSSTERTLSDGTTSSSSNTSVSDYWWLGKLDWPAADITQLSFSTVEDIYIVVRPELTVKSCEHRIPILHVYRRTKRLDTLFIESRGFDSSSTVGLFTTFAPFPENAATCALVTREKRLHIQDLKDDDSSPAIHKDIKNYRVLKLMTGWHDGKMFALGRRPANHKILLLEMTVSQAEVWEVSIGELCQLPGLSYGDEFTERLFGDEQGKKYILVAALVGAANQRAIYRVPLPEP